jgi:hypothetical protein
LLNLKPDPLLLRRVLGSHELTDGVKDDLELPIVLFLQSFKFLGKVLMSGEHLSELYKRAHDRDVDLNSARTVENATEHGNTLLGESTGEIFGMLPSL